MTAETHDYDVAANWKVVIENYQECYHCANIHPALPGVPARQRREHRTRGQLGRRLDGSRAGPQTMSLDGHSKGR